jgi:hypothetical protein
MSLGNALISVPSTSVIAWRMSASRGSRGNRCNSPVSSSITRINSSGWKTAGASEKLALEKSLMPSCLASRGSSVARCRPLIDSIIGVMR